MKPEQPELEIEKEVRRLLEAPNWKGRLHLALADHLPHCPSVFTFESSYPAFRYAYWVTLPRLTTDPHLQCA